MTICAIICEFNPFHNGHKYLLEQAKLKSGCDKILCIMSGSFTQRGECAIMDKFTRARHAVECGADIVLELPTAFATAPAEIFALGAIKILGAIPAVSTLAFGCEKQVDFIAEAKLLKDGQTAFKQQFDLCMKRGESYMTSFARGYEACGGDKNLLESPNNILALEYAKAILSSGKDIKMLPIARKGCGYSNENLATNFSSASAIRANLSNPNIASNLPQNVYNDLKNVTYDNSAFENIVKYALITTSAENLAKVTGCSEGLENKLKNIEQLPYEDIISNANGKRYSSSRIRRILTCNALQLYESDVKNFLASDLYFKPLAVKKEGKDELLNELSKGDYPTIIKGKDKQKLTPTAKACYQKDELAQKIWDHLHTHPTYTDTIITV